MENQPEKNQSTEHFPTSEKRVVPEGFIGTPDYYTDGKKVFISREFMQHMIESDPILASGIFAKKLTRQSMRERILREGQIEQSLKKMFSDEASVEDKEQVAILNQLLSAIKEGNF